MNKKLIIIIVSVVVALGIGGGAAAYFLTRGGDEGKKTLVVWTFTDELGKMITNYYEKFDTNVTVDVKTYGVNDLATKLDSALRAKKNLPDVVAIEEKYISKYADSGTFLAIDDLLPADNSMYQYTLDAAKDKDGHIMAYAWQATPGALYYRSDMAKAILGVNNPEEMQQLVDTWDKFLDVAKILKDCDPETTGFSDVRILSDVMAPARAFYSDRQTSWIVDGKLSIETQLYNDAPDSLYEIIKALQVGNGEWGGVEEPFVNETMERTTAWFTDMSGNNVFSYLLPSYSLQYDFKKYAKNDANGDDTTGKWAICKGPANYSDGGTWLGVIKSSPNAAKAKEMISYFTFNEDFLRAWANATGDFMNNKKLMTEFANDPNKSESFLGGQNHYKLFNEIAEGIKGNNRTAYDSKINSMFSEWAVNYAKIRNIGDKDTLKNDRRGAKLAALAGFVEGVDGAYSSKIDSSDMESKYVFEPAN